MKAKSFYSDDMKVNVHYYDIPGKNPAILFIHGLGSASTIEFFSVASYLSETKRRIILLDLPGSGLSDYNKNFHHSITNLVQLVANFIRCNNLKSLTLVGHSMGGSIVIELASLIPMAIEKIIVAEPVFHCLENNFSKKIVQFDEKQFIKLTFRVISSMASTPWGLCFSLSSPAAILQEAKCLHHTQDYNWLGIFLSLKLSRHLFIGGCSLPNFQADALTRDGITIHTIANSDHHMFWLNPKQCAQAILKAIIS